MKNTAITLALAALIGGVTAPMAALAQEGAPKLALEEVIVTARKRAELMQLVPVAVTAITATELEQSSIRNLQDIQGFVPTYSLIECRGCNQVLQ
jgi:iron complex outermembrane receptor protein